MSTQDIELWLENSDLVVTTVASGYWQVELAHKHAVYILHIRVHNGWLSLGAELLTYSVDNNPDTIQQFREFYLPYNETLNAAHISEKNRRVSLINNDFLSDINEDTLEREVEYFHETHAHMYPILMYEARAIGLKLE